MGKKATEPKTSRRLRSVDVRNILLVHAIEQEDAHGEILPIEDRRAATRKACEESPKADRWLALRAAGLVGRLRKIRPALWRHAQARALPRRWTVAVLVGAFIAGLASNALGPDRAINILAPPLVGFLLWNLGMYLWLIARALLPRREHEPWWQRRSSLVRALEAKAGKEPVEQAIGRRFLGDWLPVARPMATAGLAMLLHLGALAAVLGVVCGMYGRGLAFEYRATWESTFLTADFVDRLLSFFLAPARALLGLDLPSAAAIATSRSVSAAPWIHAWALTALLGVGVPRLILAAMEWIRLTMLRRRLSFELADSYVRRLEASINTREEIVQVLLYSYKAGDKSLTGLRSLLFDLVGAKARIQPVRNLDYGDDLPDAAGAGFRTCVFSAGQTPELEVHGEWLQALRDNRVDGQRLLIVVDESPFKKRLGDDSGKRLDSRRRAWHRTLEHVGLPVVFLELDDSDALDAHLERAAEGIWPTEP